MIGRHQYNFVVSSLSRNVLVIVYPDELNPELLHVFLFSGVF